MRITAKQIKLARIALDWTQPELARRANVNKGTIVNLETGQKQPHSKTLNQIIQTLRAGGIEFLENNGIRECQTNTQRYHGTDGFKEFMDDVYETAKKHGGDICLFNSRPDLWLKLLGKDWYEMHRKRMAELKNNLHMCIADQEDWNGKVFYTYGSKIAFLDFSNNSVDILVIIQEGHADNFRQLFDQAWKTEKQKPNSSKWLSGEPSNQQKEQLSEAS